MTPLHDLRPGDEATVAAVGGELSPRATGNVYCMTIVLCRDLADYKRAGEWTEATTRWCERQAISGFPGHCRVRRAEIIRLRGAFAEAELEALAIEGLDSGESIEADEQYWAEKRQRVIDRHQQTGSR
jgi:hypothetical protein